MTNKRFIFNKSKKDLIIDSIKINGLSQNQYIYIKKLLLKNGLQTFQMVWNHGLSTVVQAILN